MTTENILVREVYGSHKFLLICNVWVQVRGIIRNLASILDTAKVCLKPVPELGKKKEYLIKEGMSCILHSLCIKVGIRLEHPQVSGLSDEFYEKWLGGFQPEPSVAISQRYHYLKDCILPWITHVSWKTFQPCHLIGQV